MGILFYRLYYTIYAIICHVKVKVFIHIVEKYSIIVANVTKTSDHATIFHTIKCLALGSENNNGNIPRYCIYYYYYLPIMEHK